MTRRKSTAKSSPPGDASGEAGAAVREIPADPQADRTRVDRQFQELWFRLARTEWRSVVLVPAQRGGSAAVLASFLADAARSVRTVPVTLFIMANPADYEPALNIVVGAGQSQAIQRAHPLDYAGATQIVARATSEARDDPERSDALGKVIVAVQPVITEPLGLAVTQRADAVVLCVEAGRTRLADARRTIELIGRDRIAGCVFVRS